MADTPARSSSWKKWTAGLMLAALAVVSGLSAGSQTPPFSDVDQSHPRYADIFHAAEQGWFQGYPDGTFQPDRGRSVVEEEATRAAVSASDSFGAMPASGRGSGCGVYAGAPEISPERVLLR